MLHIQSNLAILEFFNRNATYISSSLTSLEFFDRQHVIMLHIQNN